MYVHSICESKLRVKPANASIVDKSTIIVSPSSSPKTSMYHDLLHLKAHLSDVVIKVCYI